MSKRSDFGFFKNFELISLSTSLPSGYSLVGYGSVLSVVNPVFFASHQYYNIMLGNTIYSFAPSAAGKKYSVDTGTETATASSPIATAAVVCDGTNIFVRAVGSTALYRYNVAANTYTSLTASTNAFGNATYMPSMAYDGSGKIYCLFGLADGGVSHREVQVYNISGADWASTFAVGTSGNKYCGQPYVDSGYLYTYSGRITLSSNAWNTTISDYGQNRTAAPQAYKYGTYGYIMLGCNPTASSTTNLSPAAVSLGGETAYGISVPFPPIMGSLQVFSAPIPLQLNMTPISKYGGWSDGDSIYGLSYPSKQLLRLNLYKVIMRS
ncbi:MAG: hypothetical protein K8I29_19425 [Alphaproteobacteria bacterium]|uniref:Uncharacterized protein n=1 Tax=Candidatus Nitrobium versatile TaxID=2884831 RepID=A0A953M3N4_9BACT|nr:hypothetical protein [Candidatus Nitrobium versatile]